MRLFSSCLLFILVISARPAQSTTLPKLIQQQKPSVVAIGIFNPTGSPRLKLLASGFAIGDGSFIATNYHVIAPTLDSNKNEQYVVLSGTGPNPQVHHIIKKHSEPRFDLAILQIAEKLPPVTLSSAQYAEEGSQFAFTGFPITSVLGLYPATHIAYLSAVTPIAIPADSSTTISAATLKQLRDPFYIYQLDATAYPGNSGSMLYDTSTGKVVGIINMVFVKGSRESVLSDPSGISYAIPSRHLAELLSSLTHE